jgi:hypothetical protein
VINASGLAVVEAEGELTMNSALQRPFYGREYQPTADLLSLDVPKRRYVTVEVTGNYVQELKLLQYLAREIAVIMFGRQPLSEEMPLEGFWSAPTTDMAFDPTVTGNWLWQAGFCLPDAVTSDIAGFVCNYHDLETPSSLRIQEASEGRAIQTLHAGPYDSVAATLDRVYSYFNEHDLQVNGSYHEIYLTDPFTTAPDDLRTIIRVPCREKTTSGTRTIDEPVVRSGIKRGNNTLLNDRRVA